MLMLEEFLTSMRNIILVCVDIQDDHIEFDRSKGEDMAHDKYDIALAESIFKEGYFNKEFATDIKMLFSRSEYNREAEFHPVIFYVPLVKMIFMINADEKISTQIFEEDLVKHVAIRETVFKYLDNSDDEVKEQRKKIQYKW